MGNNVPDRCHDINVSNTYKCRWPAASALTLLGFTDVDGNILRGYRDSAARPASSPVAVARSLAATTDFPILEADSALPIYVIRPLQCTSTYSEKQSFFPLLTR